MLDDRDGFQRLSREAMALHRSALGTRNPKLLPFLVNRLTLLSLMEASDDDGPTFKREAFDPAGRALDAHDPDALHEVVILADILDPGVAGALVRHALAATGGRVMPGDEHTAELSEQLAALFERVHVRPPLPADDMALEEIYRSTLARRRTVLPAGAPGLVESQHALAILLERKAEEMWRERGAASAEPVLLELIELLMQPAVDADARLGSVRSRLGASLTAQGRFADAERELLESKHLFDRRSEVPSASIQEVLNRLTELYDRWGRSSDAGRVQAQLPAISVREVTDLGPVRIDPPAAERNGGSSTRIGSRSLWVWSSERPYDVAEGGQHLWQTTAGWTDRFDLRSGPPLVHAAQMDGGLPIELLAPTPAEARFNAAHAGSNCTQPCGAGYALTPGAIVADAGRDRAVLFYTRQLHMPSADDQRTGTSVAIVGPSGDRCVRPTVWPGTDDPTMLFTAGEPAWGSAAFVRDDTLYAYACECRGLDCGCRLAKVPLAAALDRSAWRFYVGNAEWSADWRAARQVLAGIQDRASVSWNAYLGKFVAISSGLISPHVVIRVSDPPEGPWSKDDVAVIRTESSLGKFNWTGSAVGHPEFSTDGGRTEYVTYHRNAGYFKGEIRMLEIRFAKK